MAWKNLLVGTLSGVCFAGGAWAQEEFGDAPDPTYRTLLASGGARHAPASGPQLGPLIDYEVDGQPNFLATGDDTNGVDDEDGVTFLGLLAAGDTAFVDVDVQSTGGPGPFLLNAWIDFNVDGDWADPGEQIFTDAVVVVGINMLSFTVPAAATPTNLTFARFRIDSLGGLAYFGAAADGEVEDYALEVNGEDLGDAPAPYPTLRAANGARHVVGAGQYLGACVDAEADGQPAANAIGDDLGAGSTVFGVCAVVTDDEDGVAFAGALGPGDPNAPVSVSASGAALLNAWIDFNGDGDWDEANEQIFSDQALAAGVNALSFPVPPSASAGITYARFRVNSSGGLSFVGLASDGEVEDHRVEVLPGGKVPSLGPRGLGALSVALLGAGAAAAWLGVPATQRRRGGAGSRPIGGRWKRHSRGRSGVWRPS